MVREKKLQGNILLTGKRSDVPEILSMCDVFVLPSLWEGLPIALLEAMALAVPVIATDAGSNAEVVENYKNGFIVPARNPALLAQRIEELLGDPGMADNMGSRGRQTVKESFSTDGMVRAYEDLYLRHFGALGGCGGRVGH
jgi:glycosyltransferase involved in cell wall biosynthesis